MAEYDWDSHSLLLRGGSKDAALLLLDARLKVIANELERLSGKIPETPDSKRRAPNGGQSEGIDSVS